MLKVKRKKNCLSNACTRLDMLRNQQLMQQKLEKHEKNINSHENVENDSSSWRRWRSWISHSKYKVETTKQFFICFQDRFNSKGDVIYGFLACVVEIIGNAWALEECRLWKQVFLKVLDGYTSNPTWKIRSLNLAGTVYVLSSTLYVRLLWSKLKMSVLASASIASLPDFYDQTFPFETLVSLYV